MSDHDDWKDALCPGCGKPATGTSVTGWLWFCDPCDGIRWGHPQARYDANEVLHDARIKYKRALHDDMVRRLSS